MKHVRQKNSKVNKKLLIVIATVAIVIATFAIAVSVVVFYHSHDEKSEETTVVTTATQVVSMTEPTQIQTPATTAPTEPETEQSTPTPDSEQPQQLTYLLSLRQKSYDDLRALSCNQLVTVTANSTDAEIKLWECVDSKWVENESKTCYGFVGQMGTVDTMSEQISGTPRGLYPVGSAFYHYTAPDTKLDVFQITNDTYWIDDPDSKYYNQRVEGTADKDWDSAEHMADYTNYDYGFVVNYNMPAVYNAGSAIFFHIGSAPTAGCIATNESMVLSYLSALDKNLCPYILIN